MNINSVSQANSGLSIPPAAPAQRDDCKRVNTASHESVATKPLCSRSVMQSQHAWSQAVTRSQQVSKEQLKVLILSGGLADDVIYEVAGSVWISGCADLITLSGNISVAGELCIFNCPNLEELSANLMVKMGCISISGCPKLQSMTGSICVDDSLFCGEANGLTDVSGSLYVGGSLNMQHCNSLQNISGTLYVGGCLILEHCKTLNNLSGNITVHGGLQMGSCYSLTHLSGTYFVGGSIHFDNCTSLNCLPDWITSLGCAATGEKRVIGLEGSGLSKASVDQARSVAEPGMKFLFSEEFEAVDNFQEIGLALAFWGEMASCATEIPDLKLSYEEECELLSVLEQLTCSADYKDESARPVLARRVMAAMTVFTDSQLREKALDCLSEYESGCDSESEDGDYEGAMQVLKDLETLLLSGKTSQSS